MRLIETSTYELVDDSEPEFYDKRLHKHGFEAKDGYAILSHRWEGKEVKYKEYDAAHVKNPSQANPESEKALKKIKGACDIAKQQRYKWLWSDTCCIDKSDAAETTRSINSMFQWYSEAKVCYTYLCDVDVSKTGRRSFTSQNDTVRRRAKEKGIDDPQSEWFERGWTLQELLASTYLEFYDHKWTFMDTKSGLARELQRITGIDERFLKDGGLIQSASVAARMSWMAGRKTKEVEDIAYSMLGILGVTMPAVYGEGKEAFVRLQRTLMETSVDESIFAWKLPTRGLRCFQKSFPDPLPPPPSFTENTWGLLAPSPDCFEDSGDVEFISDKVIPRLGGGYKLSQQGMEFKVSVKSGSECTNMFGVPRKEIDFPLNCWAPGEKGGLENVMLKLVGSNGVYKRERCAKRDLKKGAKPSTNKVFGIDQGQGGTRTLMVPQPPYRG